MRLLSVEEITHRALPFLKDAGVVSDPVSDADAQLLELAMPLVAERINKLTEAVDMLGFLFVDEASFTRDEADVEKLLNDDGQAVVQASYDALAGLGEWSTAAIQEALQAKLVDELGLKPRNAFGPVRVADHRAPGLAAAVRVDGAARPRARARPAAERAGLTWRPGLPYHLVQRGGRPGVWRPFVGVFALVASFIVFVPVLLQVPFALGFAIAGDDVSAGLTRITDFDDPTPLGLAYLNLALAGAIPVAWLLTRVLHGLRPGWLASVAPRIRWRWLLVCFGLSFVALFATLVVSSLVPVVAGRPEMSGHLNDFTSTTRDFLLVVLLLTPLQAAGEEYAFRGYLTQAFGEPVRPIVGGGAVPRAPLRPRPRQPERADLLRPLRVRDRGRAGRRAHRRARGRHRDARPQQLARVRSGAGVQRHGVDAEPDRRQLVDDPGDAHPVARLPRAGALRGPPAGRPDDHRHDHGAGRFGRLQTSRVRFLLGSETSRNGPPEGAIGIWCNWQHDWFWSSYSRFES